MLVLASNHSECQAMSTALDQVLKDIDELSHSERALVAHCLISSLDSKQSDDVWSELVETKFPELGLLAADNVMSEATEFTEPIHPSWKNKRLRKKIQGKPLSSAVLDDRGSGN